MLKNWKALARIVSISLVVVMFMPSTGNAVLINIINFFGANLMHDAEAEYRLADLGKQIIHAKKMSNDLSLSIKESFSHSVMGNFNEGFAVLEQTHRLGGQTHEQWDGVSNGFVSTRDWLRGKIRPEYAQAFCESAMSDIHQLLIQVGASAHYMAWAFGEIDTECRRSATPEDAIDSALTTLASLANKNAENTSHFLGAFDQSAQNDAFVQGGLYGYIFDQLGIEAIKPEILTRDEAYFVGVSNFDIYYEVFEQIARDAHTRVPGSHGPELRTFDGQFTN